MSLSAQRAFVETTFFANVNASAYANPIQWQNTRLSPSPEGPWWAIFILEGTSRQTNLGLNFVERHVGVLQIDAIVPEHTGMGLAEQMAEWAGAYWRARDTQLSDGSYLRFRTPSIKIFPPNNGVARACMSIDYWRDDPT